MIFNVQLQSGHQFTQIKREFTVKDLLVIYIKVELVFNLCVTVD